MSTLKVNNLEDLGADAVVTNGVIASSALPAGSILQVVSTTKTDTFTTSSTSFVDITGLTASITPTSATSKILVSYSTLVGNSSADSGVFIQVVRDSTNIALSTGGSSSNQTAQFWTGITRNFTVGVLAGDFLDSPNTTSATTYKIQLRASGATAVLNRQGDGAFHGSVSTITVMEVAG